MKNKRYFPILVPGGPMAQGGLDPTVTDPLGSYTGVPKDPYETPVQDADDL